MQLVIDEKFIENSKDYRFRHHLLLCNLSQLLLVLNLWSLTPSPLHDGDLFLEKGMIPKYFLLITGYC